MADKSIIDRIHEFDRFGSVLGLERLEELLRRLGDPQKGMKFVHVAGTNGKGSVCKFLDSGLNALGYRTGLYISPFIEVFNERIQFCGGNISDDELDRYGWQAVRAAEEMVADGLVSPTEFEVVMASAFLFFRAKDPDFVILECGMGGEGDATNIIRSPLACVFTSVSYDHMEVLGDTLEKIAATKAGIIKDGAPVVSNVRDRGPAEVIRAKALEKGSAFYDVSEIPCGIRTDGPVSQTVSVAFEDKEYRDVEISMAGDHQAENLKAALAVFEILRHGGQIEFDEEKLREGLKTAVQPGRFEIVRGRKEWAEQKIYAPMYILDGAHNEAGAEALSVAMKRYFAGRRILLVTGILADKEVEKILDHFLRITENVICTEPVSPRRMAAEELAGLLRKRGTEPAGTVKEPSGALRLAESMEKDYDVILFAGSLYLIGEVRRLIRNGADKGTQTAPAVL